MVVVPAFIGTDRVHFSDQHDYLNTHHVLGGWFFHNTYIESIQRICMTIDTTTDNFLLSTQDAIRETTEKFNTLIERGDQRARNLLFLRQDYVDKLKQTTKRHRSAVPGIPIFLTEDDLKLDRVLLHTTVYPRSFFTAKPKGGAEIIYTSAHRGGQGYQWYVMTWQLVKGKLNIWCSHWMIDRDEQTKRNTVWFTRGFTFNEAEKFDLDGRSHPTMLSSWERMKYTPDRHHRISTSQAVKHSLRFDDLEGWITTTSASGAFEIMYKLNVMLKQFDMSEHQSWYLNKHFKIFWSLRVLEVVWGKEWSTKKFDVDGILKDLWFYPSTTHFLDKERFESIREDWDTVRVKYEEWIKEFRFPPHINAPQPDEQHLLKPPPSTDDT